MKNLKTSEVLDLAADAIQMAGWATANTSEDPWGEHVLDGPLCLEGGIMAAAGVRHRELRSCPAYIAVREYLAPFVTDFDSCPWYFNDSIAETADDVIAVLRAAAAVERTKEAVYSDEDQPLPLEQEQVA